MPQFAYEALTEQGTVQRGEAGAADEAELETRLREQGQYLIRAESRPQGDPGGSDAQRARKMTDGNVNRADMLAFTEYLWGATQAGIPILTTLDDIGHQLGSELMRKITSELGRSMAEEGKTLSEAMAEHPQAFSRLYVATVEAGETTGQLDYALQQLVDYLEWNREITIQIRQATLYPVIVLAVMGLLIGLLVVFVYPRLLPVFEGFNVELPWPTRAVMAAGDYLRRRWMLVLGTLLLTALVWRSYGRTREGRLRIDSFKLRMPVFGRLLHDLEMARLVTYMGLFYRTGVDLLRGLALLEQMMTNTRVAQAVGQARAEIAGGDSIAHALAQTRLFPTVVIRSFALGESTGKLDESLERARVYYAREVPASVRRMLSALQPLLIVFLGGVIALVALSIFLPIIRIYESVGS
ncbi:MAG: type II secretion system F family protein [Gemmatimonadetes bacterium]|nr:type II secretion system F family protein [Gemmatimonadota bacterium]